MAHIVFGIDNQEGHFVAVLALAKALRERGHRITFASLDPSSPDGPNVETRASEENFAYVPLLSLFMAGEIPAAKQLRDPLERADVEQWRRMFDRLRHARSLDGRSGAEIDLFVCDVLYPLFAAVAKHCGIPVVALSTSLPCVRVDGFPPLHSPLVPGRSRFFSQRAKLAWTRALWTRRLRDRLVSIRGARLEYPMLVDVLPELLGTKTVRDGLFTPALGLPTLVLCPRELDFPGMSDPNQRYVGPTIDVTRRQPEFDWQRLQPDRRIVLCAFGSQSHIYSDTESFVRALVKAFARLPTHQLVIAGSPGAILERAELPENVVAMQSVPQLTLLERAALMVTHAGLSSVKECVWAGVPMLAIPRVNDQTGNAARIAFHGLGKVLSPKQADPDRLREWVLELDGDRRLRDRLERMRAAFIRAEQKQEGVAVIEERLTRRSIS